MSPDPGCAGPLAAAFAADYLSWDESDPNRRGRALGVYVGRPGAGELAGIGWCGTGRQRAEFAVPGPARPVGANRLVVDVRVRVTPYRRLTDVPRAGPEAVDVMPFPAAAPAPAAPGWRSLGSHWCAVLVPLTAVEGRWMIDITAVRVVPPIERCGS